MYKAVYSSLYHVTLYYFMIGPESCDIILFYDWSRIMWHYIVLWLVQNHVAKKKILVFLFLHFENNMIYYIFAIIMK